MVVDVELRHGVMDFALYDGVSMVVFPTPAVFVSRAGYPGSASSGLTELDALGAFREHVAFLWSVPVNEVDLRFADNPEEYK